MNHSETFLFQRVSCCCLRRMKDASPMDISKMKQNLSRGAYNRMGITGYANESRCLRLP